MQRQSLTAYRTLGDKRGEAKSLGNIGDARIDRGDLRGAIQLYEQSMKADPEDVGRAIIARHNIASVLLLQGDLAGAKRGFNRSLAAWRDSGDQSGVADATLSLAGLLLAEGDFFGARKDYQQVLEARTASDEKLAVAEIQLALANLSLEEGMAPAEQESAIRQTIEVFRQQHSRDDEIQAWCMLARALTAQGNAADAKSAVQHAQSLASKSQNPEVRWRTSITAARVGTTDKNSARSATGIAARSELSAVIAQSHQLGYGVVELNARFAMAEIEIKVGQTARGRAHMAAVESDAKAKGYYLLVRKTAAV